MAPQTPLQRMQEMLAGLSPDERKFVEDMMPGIDTETGQVQEATYDQPLLTIGTETVQRPWIDVDGKPIYFKIGRDLGLIEQSRIPYLQQEVTRLQTQIARATTYKAQEPYIKQLRSHLEELVDTVLLNCPAEKIALFSDHEKLQIAALFTRAVALPSLSRQAPHLQAVPNPPAPSTSTSSSRASKGSTKSRTRSTGRGSTKNG